MADEQRVAQVLAPEFTLLSGEKISVRANGLLVDQGTGETTPTDVSVVACEIGPNDSCIIYSLNTRFHVRESQVFVTTRLRLLSFGLRLTTFESGAGLLIAYNGTLTISDETPVLIGTPIGNFRVRESYATAKAAQSFT